jgi:cellulose synthase/poly-beta-1,6-N-acetylglucosamine synthase-like glycosyltransferase
MVKVIITARGEPKATEQAIKAILAQEIDNIKIIVCDPFTEVKQYLKEKFPDNKRIEFFLDPDEGKSTALNMLLEMHYNQDKNEILVFTDGDVFLGKGSLKALLNMFKDPKIGIVCGHPVSMNPRNNMFGFWSYMFFDEMNKNRKKLFKKGKFFAISGYLFAMRNGIVKRFPTETNEDKVIPSLFWNRGYKIGYNENARVYVLNPQNMKDFLLQKKRNIKGRIALKSQIGIVHSKETNFINESIRGIKVFFTYPNNFKEAFWIIIAMYARLRAWLEAFYEIKFKKQVYKDGWRVNETETTKPLD